MEQIYFLLPSCCSNPVPSENLLKRVRQSFRADGACSEGGGVVQMEMPSIPPSIVLLALNANL